MPPAGAGTGPATKASGHGRGMPRGLAGLLGVRLPSAFRSDSDSDGDGDDSSGDDGDGLGVRPAPAPSPAAFAAGLKTYVAERRAAAEEEEEEEAPPPPPPAPPVSPAAALAGRVEQLRREVGALRGGGELARGEAAAVGGPVERLAAAGACEVGADGAVRALAVFNEAGADITARLGAAGPALAALRSLELIKCGLRAVPATALPALTHLHLPDNRIGGVVDFADAALPHLEDLDLEGNAIAEIHGLEACPKLCSVNVAWNRLGTLAAFADLPRLKRLNAARNRIEAVPAAQDLRGLARVEELILAGNAVATRAAGELMRALPNATLEDALYQ